MRPYVIGVRMSLASRLMPRLRRCAPARRYGQPYPGNVRILTLCAVAAIAALAAPAAQAQAPRQARLQAGRDAAVHRGSVSFLRVRGARGALVVEESAGPRLRQRVEPASGGPLPPDELRAPCDRQLLGARPTDRPLLRPGSRSSTVAPACARPYDLPAPAACGSARPALFPPPERVRAARRFLAQGRVVSWALIDSHGRMRPRARRTFISASLVKAMLLVAYLRELGNRPVGRRAGAARPDDHEVRQQAGHRGLRPRRDPAPACAGRPRRDEGFSVSGYWSGAHFSAADQARFSASSTRLVPKRSRAYAHALLVDRRLAALGLLALLASRRLPDLLQGRLALHRPRAPRPRGRTLRAGPLRVSMAVLSDGNPSHDWRTATLQGWRRISGRTLRWRASAARHPAPRTGYPASSSPTRPATTSPAAARATARTGRSCSRTPRARRPRAAPPSPPRTRAASAGRLSAGARLACLVRWAERSGRGDLVGTYIARRSRHNTGSAVDLTLVRADSGRPLRMGTGHDNPHARTRRTRPAAPCATA